MAFYYDLFKEIALELNPYYGVCATEIGIFPTMAEEVALNSETMGDYIYLCDVLVEKTDIKTYSDDFSIVGLINKGVMMSRIKNIFELGK